MGCPQEIATWQCKITTLIGNASSNGCSAIVMLVSGGDIFAYVLGDMYITPNFPRFRCCLFWQQNISNETEVAPHQHIVQILFAKNKTRWAVLYLGVLTTAFTNWLQTIGQQLEVENLTRCDGSVRSYNNWMGQVLGQLFWARVFNK